MIRLLLSALLALLPSIATAHDSPTGWAYEYSCCSSMDCRILEAGAVQETSAGYVVKLTGELIPYNDKRVRPSQDEFFHQCTLGGVITAEHSLCLYVPNRGF